MLKMIGGAVVYGLAAYGLYKLATRPRLKVVIEAVPAQAKPEATETGAEEVPASGPMEQTGSGGNESYQSANP